MPEDLNFSSLERTGMLKQDAENREKGIESAKAQTSIVIPQDLAQKSFTPLSETSSPALSKPKRALSVPSMPSGRKRRSAQEVQALRTRCKQLGVSFFFQENVAVRTLGFTSAIPGEGKTFLARLTAEVLAEDNDVPVTLLECNWENPTLSAAYDLMGGPGLSDWLVGRCSLEAIRRQVKRNLTVIPAGDSSFSATKALRELQQKGVNSLLTHPDELLILDLPATVTTAYGPLAAHLADALILVIRMGVTPEPFVTEACNYLKDLPVHGVILNQVVSRIPRWLRRIL